MSKFTQDELRELFGVSIPMEVVSMLFDGPGDMTVAEFRAWVRGYAAGMKHKPTPLAAHHSNTQYPGPRQVYGIDGVVYPDHNPISPNYL